MTDPYKVLQVSPSASDSEVKSAYRELARKYHPDNFNGNPLSDLATEKMQEINEAYDIITQQRRDASGWASSEGSPGDDGYDGASQDSYSDGGYTGGSQFADIRRLINTRRITDAEELLDGIPQGSRDAEWYFLKGTIQHFRGWTEYACDNYRIACGMDPLNIEYRNAYNQAQRQRQTASPHMRAPVMNVHGCGICDACAALYCANCFCNCLGGGC